MIEANNYLSHVLSCLRVQRMIMAADYFLLRLRTVFLI
jgi:hypothetical protein